MLYKGDKTIHEMDFLLFKIIIVQREYVINAVVEEIIRAQRQSQLGRGWLERKGLLRVLVFEIDLKE